MISHTVAIFHVETMSEIENPIEKNRGKIRRKPIIIRMLDSQSETFLRFEVNLEQLFFKISSSPINVENGRSILRSEHLFIAYVSIFFTPLSTDTVPDFARPKLRLAKYAKGDFRYILDKIFVDGSKMTLMLKADSTAFSTLGMPEKACVVYSFKDDGIGITVQWFNKPANRLPEEIWLNMPFATDAKAVTYTKLGHKVSPCDVVVNGSRNLSCVQEVSFATGEADVKVKCMTPAPISMGKGKLLRFDNETGDGTQGFSFLLYNNIWGTNYPLWYSDNAGFEWDVEVKKINR